MAINYSNTTWANGITPINDTNLNKMETGIKSACDGVDIINSNLLKTKLLTYSNVTVLKSSGGVYYRALNSISEIGLSKNQILGISTYDWNGCTANFTPYISDVSVGITSDIGVTIQSLVLRVIYI